LIDADVEERLLIANIKSIWESLYQSLLSQAPFILLINLNYLDLIPAIEELSA
jgi:hypothetical protein